MMLYIIRQRMVLFQCPDPRCVPSEVLPFKINYLDFCFMKIGLIVAIFNALFVSEYNDLKKHRGKTGKRLAL